MSKLIFNPKKDMKELEKYGFIIREKVAFKKVYLNNDDDDRIIYSIYPDNSITVILSGYEVDLDDTLYKLIKANLIIDEEELKCANVK